jgi:hypothetical protein
MRPVLLALLASLLLAASAQAAVELRWAPADSTIPTGDPGYLSVYVDEAIDIRTVDLTVHYDSSILSSVDGSPGLLFTESGCSLFPDFQDDTPGEWYGACVALGFDCWVTGPGELYRWDFEGVGPGFSHIDAVQVRLFDPDALLIEDVTLPGTVVFVGDGTDVAPGADPTELGLGLYPNPFNPRVRLNLTLPPGREAVLDVYDLSGRHLARPWSGTAEKALSLDWTAVDAAGRTLPSGVYLFRLEDDRGQTLTRSGVLLK